MLKESGLEAGLWKKPKIRPAKGEEFEHIKEGLRRSGLNTVCEGAHCPNIWECWNSGTATFMIMGNICTRSCRFCAVKKGRFGERLDPSEPYRLRAAVRDLNLNYVVLTSVDRDDLPDGGASHFAECIKAIKAIKCKVEALIPDFQGDERALGTVVDSGPEAICHNIETPERLQPRVRDRRASYRQSLKVLKNVKKMSRRIYTKTSIMLGLGETEEDVLNTMDDLLSSEVDILTLGQYLRPGKKYLEVREYISPQKFDHYKRIAEEKGFISVVSGPLVRSSYKAAILR